MTHRIEGWCIIDSRDGSISYSLLVLDLGKYETRVRVLDSRWYHLIGREQMWLTHILNELKG